MSLKEDVKKSLENNTGSLKMFLKDINEEESLARPDQNINHIRWIVGHIVVHAEMMLKILKGNMEMPEGWDNMFAYKSQLLDDTSQYPSMKELLDKYDDIYNSMYARLENMSDEELKQEFGEFWGKKEIRSNGIQWLGKHEYYHMGQITLIRKMLGKPTLI